MTKSGLLAIAAASVAALLVTPVLADKVTGKLEAVSTNELTVKGDDGKSFKAKLSGSRTSVMIAGKKGDRAALKDGMSCTVEAPKAGEEATTVDCK